MVQADRLTLFEILQMLAVKDAHKEDDLGVDDFIWVNVRETSGRNPRPGSSVKGISRYYGVLSLDGLCVLKRGCSTSIPWPDPCGMLLGSSPSCFHGCNQCCKTILCSIFLFQMQSEGQQGTTTVILHFALC